jgi:hypothetical protein
MMVPEHVRSVTKLSTCQDRPPVFPPVFPVFRNQIRSLIRSGRKLYSGKVSSGGFTTTQKRVKNAHTSSGIQETNAPESVGEGVWPPS